MRAHVCMSSIHHIPALVVAMLPFLAELRDSIVVFDGQGHWLYGNPSFTRLVQYTAESEDGIPWISAENAESWRYFFDLHRSGRATELGLGPAQIDVVCRDGSRQTVAVRWDRVVDNDRGVIAMLGLIRPFPSGGDSNEADLTPLLAELAILVVRLVTKAEGREHVSGNGWHGSDLNGAPDTSTRGELSPREQEILTHMLAGRRISTTARELYLSEHTVRNHLKRIYRKLGVHSLGELRERHTPVPVR